MKDPNDNKQYLSFIAEETAAVSPKFSTYAEDFDYDDKGINRNKELVSDKLVPMDIDERAIIAALADGEHIFDTANIFGYLAIILAAINIFGGFLVTQRMLAMYKKKKDKK